MTELRTATGSLIARIDDMVGDQPTLTTADGDIVLHTIDADGRVRILRVEPSTGAVSWSRDVAEEHSTLGFDQQGRLLLTRPGSLTVLDPVSGQLLAEETHPEIRHARPGGIFPWSGGRAMIVQGSTILFLAEDGTIAEHVFTADESPAFGGIEFASDGTSVYVADTPCTGEAMVVVSRWDASGRVWARTDTDAPDCGPPQLFPDDDGVVLLHGAWYMERRDGRDGSQVWARGPSNGEEGLRSRRIALTTSGLLIDVHSWRDPDHPREASDCRDAHKYFCDRTVQLIRAADGAVVHTRTTHHSERVHPSAQPTARGTAMSIAESRSHELVFIGERLAEDVGVVSSPYSRAGGASAPPTSLSPIVNDARALVTEARLGDKYPSTRAELQNWLADDFAGEEFRCEPLSGLDRGVTLIRVAFASDAQAEVMEEFGSYALRSSFESAIDLITAGVNYRQDVVDAVTEQVGITARRVVDASGDALGSVGYTSMTELLFDKVVDPERQEIMRAQRQIVDATLTQSLQSLRDFDRCDLLTPEDRNPVFEQAREALDQELTRVAELLGEYGLAEAWSLGGDSWARPVRDAVAAFVPPAKLLLTAADLGRSIFFTPLYGILADTAYSSLVTFFPDQVATAALSLGVPTAPGYAQSPQLDSTQTHSYVWIDDVETYAIHTTEATATDTDDRWVARQGEGWAGLVIDGSIATVDADATNGYIMAVVDDGRAGWANITGPVQNQAILTPRPTHLADVDSPILAAVNLSEHTVVPRSADRVIIARDDAFADSLAGSALAGHSAPILFVPGGPSGTLPDVVADEIRRVLTPRDSCGDEAGIFILGGTNAVSSSIEHALADHGCVTRIAGPTRIQTALRVADVVADRDDPDEVFIARADDWADALVGGPGAGTRWHPCATHPGQRTSF